MKTAFVGTKIVTTGITNPVQLNRGEIAFFSASGVLISSGSGLTVDTPITAFRGLGNGKVSVGATLYKGRLSKTSAASVTGVSYEYHAIEGVIDYRNHLIFSTTIKDPFTGTNYPRMYMVEAHKGVDETDVAFITRFAELVKTKAKHIQADLKDDTGFVVTTVVTQPADAAPQLEIKVVIKQALNGGVSIDGMTFGTVTIVPTKQDKNKGTEVALVEKQMAVHRGYNKEMKEDQGAVTDEYWTTDKNAKYKMYCLATVTESPDSLSNEDGKGYTVEQLIFIDEANTTNITAADAFIASF